LEEEWGTIVTRRKGKWGRDKVLNSILAGE